MGRKERMMGRKERSEKERRCGREKRGGGRDDIIGVERDLDREEFEGSGEKTLYFC